MNNIIPLLDEMRPVTDKDSSYEYNGIKVPRVTHILSKCIHSDSLMYWANSLGFKRMSYRRTINNAANIGSICHNAIDFFLENNNEPEIDNIPMESWYAYESFCKWYKYLISQNDVKVIFHEKTLVCKYFGGTLDGLYEINGKTYLVDYKTSNHVTYKYFLQLAAYRYMLRNVLGIEIDGCIVLQLSKTSLSYNEYVLNFVIPDHLKFINECETAFLSLVFAYYNITHIETRFNKMDWEVGIGGHEFDSKNG